MIHELKTHSGPDIFEAVWDGRKSFEIRVDDRGYQIGDTLVLREYYPQTDEYSGRWIMVKVSSLIRGWGLPDNLVVMGWKEREKMLGEKVSP